MKFSCFSKKIAILVIGARPTAFHKVETVGCEAFGKAEFIGKRKVNALALSAIAQGGVVNGQMRGGGHKEKA